MAALLLLLLRVPPAAAKKGPAGGHADYRKALLLKPWFPEAMCNLVHTFQFISDW